MPIDRRKAKLALAAHHRDQKARNRNIKREISAARSLFWLAQSRIALSNVHVLAAAPGAGLSTVLTHWIARLSRGDSLLPGYENEEGWGASWYAQLGHDIARIEYPRLQAAGADLTQVIVSPENNKYEIDAQLKPIQNLKMVVVDYDKLACPEDEDHTLFNFLEKFKEIAKRRKIAVVLGARLPAKASEADRRLEEICALPQATAVYLVERRAQDHVLRVVRNRFGSDTDSTRFRIVSKDLDWPGGNAPVVEWLENSETGSAYSYTTLERCIEWVRSNAQRGLRSTTFYERALQSGGFSKSTVTRALEPAGFKSEMITGADNSRFAVILRLLDDPSTAISEGMLLGASQLDDDQEL